MLNASPLSVTTYSGFSNVSGHMPLERLFTLISSSVYEHLIRKIDRFIREGKIKEANCVKRQIPFFTVTANYSEKRLPESICGYNDLITIDIDGLSDEQVIALRTLIEQDTATIGNFLTPKQHGYKIIAYLVNTETQALRQTYLQGKTLTYEQLEKYHERIYEITRRHYEQTLGVEVDTSGKDLSRGIFASHDPEAFFSSERAADIQPVSPRIIPAEPAPKQKKRKTKQASTDIPKAEEPTDIDPITLIEFNKCVALTRRTIRYTEGNHNTFLFTLGNKCFRHGLGEEDVKRLAAHHFSEGGKWDTNQPIENGFTYISKTEKAKKEKEERRPVIEQVKSFLDTHYCFRRNTLLDRLEIKELSTRESTQDNPETSSFRVMAIKDLNTVFLRMSEAGITYALGNLRSVIDSDYAKPFDPFREYFDALPKWNGTKDYIGELADTIQTTDQVYWHEIFRRWIVGMVTCAMGAQNINQQALLLHGKQGKGKSTWIRNLLPPELREYYRNGMIDPGNKDDMFLLTTRILINMEEFEGVKQADLAGLKRIISQESVTLRKPYDIQARTYPRRASFIGSTNNARFLSDIGGSRRFLVVEAQEINYRKKTNYTGLYGQVMHLIEHGFQHWFEGEEIDKINRRNEQHRMKDPLEENLYIYFRPATPYDYDVKWQPAAAILSFLSAAGRTQANAQSQQLLIQVLEREKFMNRVNPNGVTEYGVITLTQEEMERNAKRIE